MDDVSGAEYVRAWTPDLPGGSLVRTGPRVTTFLARSMSRSARGRTQRFPEIPTRVTTPGLVLSVLADELMLAMMSSNRLLPESQELARIRDEVERSVAGLAAAGMLDDPASFHEDVAPAGDIRLTPRRYRHIRYQELSFSSGYRPSSLLAAGERWQGMEANRTAVAYVLQHRHGPRLWLVNLHGFGMGRPSDLIAFRSLRFHRELGFNVLHPVLPLHGPRRMGRRSGEGMATFDFLNNVHGLAQAISDIRRSLAWVRQQGAESIAVHGVSLGGYTAALLAGVDDGVDTVIAGVPPVDLVWAMRHHASPKAKRTAHRFGLLGDQADAVHRVVSPLAFPCRTPAARRFVYAGVADRMSTPKQAYLLWKHWGEPEACWYRGSHIGFALSGEVRRFVDHALGVATNTP